MTDKQADTNRNDLIDLMIEKAKRILSNKKRACRTSGRVQQAQALTQQ